MISRICMCCGEAFSYKVNEERPNPNICAACSQMAALDEPEERLDPNPELPDLVSLLNRLLDVQKTRRHELH